MVNASVQGEGLECKCLPDECGGDGWVEWRWLSGVGRWLGGVGR